MLLVIDDRNPQPASERDGGRVANTTELNCPQISNVSILESHAAAVASGRERPPEDIGKIKDYSRKTIIDAARTLAIAVAVRKCSRNTILAAALLDYVGTRSDNSFGRCIDGAERIAEALDCDERTLRAVRTKLVAAGALRVNVRVGRTPEVWLPYTDEAMEMSANAIWEKLAPPRRDPGRPRTSDDLTENPWRMCPGFCEIPRASTSKTPGIDNENPGSQAATCKSSLQDHKQEGVAHSRPTGSASLDGSEVKGLGNGVEHICRALRAQNLAPMKDGFADWKAAVARSEACRSLSDADAHALAGVIVKAGERFWPPAALIVDAVEKRQKYFSENQRRWDEYDRRRQAYTEYTEAREARRDVSHYPDEARQCPQMPLSERMQCLPPFSWPERQQAKAKRFGEHSWP